MKYCQLIYRIVTIILLPGTLVRRHRIPRPPPHDDQFYRVEDFNIGQEINLYSRVYKITGGDPFTHNFLRKLGVKVGDEAKDTQPHDPYTRYRKAVSEEHGYILLDCDDPCV